MFVWRVGVEQMGWLGLSWMILRGPGEEINRREDLAVAFLDTVLRFSCAFAHPRYISYVGLLLVPLRVC